MTSVSAPDEKWQSLERKLQRGKTLEQAAEESGVDLAEAKKWLEGRRENRGFDEDALLLAGAEAFYYGLDALIALSQIREGRVGTETEVSGDGAERTARTVKFDHPDLGAAQELVRTALKIRQMAKAKDARPEDPNEDLFDRAPTHGNWRFPKKE